LETLDRLSKEDPEWFVRSAATDVMERKQTNVPQVWPAQRPEDVAWLTEWSASQGRGIATSDAALDALYKALNDGDWLTQLAAVDTLRACGSEGAIQPLRSLLSASDILVRDAVYAALEEIGKRTGVRIPMRVST
jgi:hypothetical protein